MHANKLTGEARTYIAILMQLGCFTFNTQLSMRENMHANIDVSREKCWEGQRGGRQLLD